MIKTIVIKSMLNIFIRMPPVKRLLIFFIYGSLFCSA